jgi:hypothetical protein
MIWRSSAWDSRFHCSALSSSWAHGDTCRADHRTVCCRWAVRKYSEYYHPFSRYDFSSLSQWYQPTPYVWMILTRQGWSRREMAS